MVGGSSGIPLTPTSLYFLAAIYGFMIMTGTLIDSDWPGLAGAAMFYGMTWLLLLWIGIHRHRHPAEGRTPDKAGTKMEVAGSGMLATFAILFWSGIQVPALIAGAVMAGTLALALIGGRRNWPEPKGGPTIRWAVFGTVAAVYGVLPTIL